MTRILVLTIVIFLTCSVSAFAATLDDYHRRLDAARSDIVDMRRVEDGSVQYDRFRRQKLEDIRRSIPKTEHLEWPGGSIDTDNQWLHDGLSAYADEDNVEARKTVLFSIEERLAAISEKVGDLKKATGAERAKDEDKQKLAEILRREEYQKPEVKEESLFQKWWSAFWKWLEDLFPKPTIQPQTDTNFGSLRVVFQILIYAAVIGAVGFLLYRFFPHIAGRFGFKKKEKKKQRVILGERIGDDESADDLFSEAERLAREGQLRDAIRKGYIAVLCELSDRKIIGLARHKTNRDYLRDVKKRAGLLENMSGLTNAYESNWYGLRPSQNDDWEDFRSKYKQTIASVNA